MAPSASSRVTIHLAEPVIILRNLDSATDRRERRLQRRRAQAATNSGATPSTAAGLTTSHNGSSPVTRNDSPATPNGATSGTVGGGASGGNATQPPTNPSSAAADDGNASSNNRGRGAVPPFGRGGAGSASPGPRSGSRGRLPSRPRPSHADSTTNIDEDVNGMSSSPLTSLGGPGGGRTTARSASRSAARDSSVDTAARGRSHSGFRGLRGLSRDRGASASPATGSTGNGDGNMTPVIQPESNDIDRIRPPAVIRGVLTVNLSKPTRIKKIGVRLKGVSKTDWPEGIGHRRLDTSERSVLIDEQILFFDASALTETRRSSSVGPPVGSSRTRSRSRAREATAGGSQDTTVSHIRPSTAPMSNSWPSSAPTAAEPPSTAAQLQRSLSPETGTTAQPNNYADIPTYSDSVAMGGPSSSRLPSASSPSPASPASPTQPTSPPSPQIASVASNRLNTAGTYRQQSHGVGQDRMAELRAQAGVGVVTATPTPITSAAPSRASSIHNLDLATGISSTASSFENGSLVHDSNSSRDPSLHSLAEPHQHPDLVASPPSSTHTDLGEQNALTSPEPDAVPDNPLELVGTNMSQMSLSSRSEEEHRGRGRARDTMAAATNFSSQAILESENEADLDGHSRRASISSGMAAAGPSTYPPPRSSTLPPSLPSSTAGTESAGQTHPVPPMGRQAVSGPTNVLRASSGDPRSSSVASSASTKGKSTRFASLSNFVRGKSASRTRKAAAATATSEDPYGTGARSQSTSSTNGHDTTGKRDRSRGRAQGLKAIKQALLATAHHHGSSHVTKSAPGSIYSESETDVSDDEDGPRGRNRSSSHHEFKPGTYTYALYIPIPNSLPPTIHANHGSVVYMLKGFVKRSGALTSNLSSLSEVHIVAAPGEDDMEASESIIVERMWETQLSYKIVIHCKSVPVGGEIPISIRLNPLTKMKVFRVTTVLEEKYTFYAKDHKVARSPTTRKYELCKVYYPDNSPLLPIVSDSPDALASSPLRDWIVDSSSSDNTGVTTLDPLGPWILESSVKVPDCSSTLHFSTSHEKANISVIHSLKVCIRVERGDDEAVDAKGNRKKFDIIVEAPMHILSCRTNTITSLPTYTLSAPREHAALANASAESSFHPHELSDIERYALHGRNSHHGSSVIGSLTPRNNSSPAHSIHRGNTSHSSTLNHTPGNITDESIQRTLLNSAWATAVPQEPPPPTYEDAQSHTG